MSIYTESLSIPTPNYCQIPNIVLDEWMLKLGHAEFKILMFICRKTFGWHKLSDRISLSQIQKATGFVKNHITKAIKSLCEKGLLRKLKTGEKGTEKTYYEIILTEDSNNSYQYLKDTPPSIFKIPTKETTTKEIEKEKDEKEKVLCGVKTPAPPPLLFFKKRIKMEMCSYKRLVNEFGESKIDEMIDRLDEYADINPRRFRQYAKHDVVIRKWIREDALKPKSKAVIEALEIEKKEEQQRILEEQKKAREILEAKKRQAQDEIFNQKLQKNLPIIAQYVNKFSSVLRIYSKINGLYEIRDKHAKYHICSFVNDNFQETLKQQLRDSGIGLDYADWPFCEELSTC